MIEGLFEGSYLGDNARLAAGTKLECGVCWHVYDPAEGDDVRQIPPGTPFALLPEDWTCPDCASPKQRFMVVGERDDDGDPVVVAGRLVDAYRLIEERMRDLPIHNPRLGVEAIGFRRVGDGVAGVIVTPWMMAIVRVPEADAAAIGAEAERGFPSGVYPFIGGELSGVGAIESCSLFSPMDEFVDMDAARMAAESAVEGLFHDPAAVPQAPVALDRRALMFGRGAA